MEAIRRSFVDGRENAASKWLVEVVASGGVTAADAGAVASRGPVSSSEPVGSDCGAGAPAGDQTC